MMCNIRDIRELFRMAGRVRRFIILTLLRCPFEALRTTLQASFLQFAFGMINKENQNGLYYVCVLFGIGSLFLFLYNGTVWTFYATYVIKWVGAIRRKLFSHISCLSLRQIEAKPSGEWITRLNSDVHAATAMLNQNLHIPHAVVAIVNICVSSMILVMMNPGIFGLIIMFVIPHILFSQLLIAKPMTRFALNAQETAAKNTTDMNALVTCADTAILYDAQGFLLKRFEKSSLELRRANMKIQHRKALESGLLPFMGMSGYLVILLMGGSWIAAGTMTFGELTAAFQYRGGLLIGSMMLINSLMNIRTALAGVKRVNETMGISLEE
jgi:ABC-type multidrug transport system fused ATPase/permease subunit